MINNARRDWAADITLSCMVSVSVSVTDQTPTSFWTGFQGRRRRAGQGRASFDLRFDKSKVRTYSTVDPVDD